MKKTSTRLIKIVDEMDSTLLLIFGDHGMAASGEHGGNSDDEKNIALFAFTSKNLRFNGEDDIIEKYSTVYQVLKLILFPIHIFFNLSSFCSNNNIIS